MNREAAEQVAGLARIYERRGESDTAERLLQEAKELNPALEEAAAEVGVSTEEELELTLTPEEDLEGVGLEADVVAEPEGPGVEDEIPVLSEASMVLPDYEANPRVATPEEMLELIKLSYYR